MPFQKYMHIWIICISEIYAWIMHFYACVIHNIPANISTLFQRWLLVDMTSQRGTTSNQRWNNVFISTLEFTTLKNVETSLFISTLMWTTLDKVETMLFFSTSSFTTLVNTEETLWKWPFPKKTKKIISNWITEYTEFKILTAIS